MNQILLTLGGLTLGGSAAVVLLALAGRAGGYGARWRCWAWLLLCLRLAVPLPLLPQSQTRAPIQVDIPNPPAAAQPPDNSAPPGQGTTSGDAPPAPSQNGPAGNASSPAPAVPSPSGPEESPTPGQLLPLLPLGLWLIPAAAILVWNGRAHLRFLSWLRRWSSPVTDEAAIRAFHQLGDQLGLRKRPRLLMCQGLKVPMLAGLLRPAILLPRETVTGEDLGFSLLHELTHYRRRDIWLKALAMWVNALHWFNPFMWYMVRLVERDTELACDEDALRRLSPRQFAAYGQTILDAVVRLRNRHE